MDFSTILLFIDSLPSLFDSVTLFIHGDGGRQALGSDDPIVKGLFLSMFAVTGFGIMLNLFNSAVRKKMVDQTKLKRIMKETKTWQKARMSAMRSKDQAKTAELNKKSSYILHEQDVYGNDADEHETYDDYICTFNFDILSCIATTLLIHCCDVSNSTKCNSRRYVPTNLFCRTSIRCRTCLFW